VTDSCPSCAARDIPPADTAHRKGRIVHGYQCRRCGHTWATVRDLAAYSDIHHHAANHPGRRAA
jgi:hypothetical protein